MLSQFLPEAGRLGPTMLVAVLGAMLGWRCAGFAARYSRLLLMVLQPGGCAARSGWIDDRSLLLCAAGLGKEAPFEHSDCGHVPVMLRYGAAVLMCACVLVFERRHGLSPAFFCLVVACAMLSVLALVDAATGLLPDTLTSPLLWLGVALAWTRGPLSLHDSIAGAMAGYGFLWFLFWLYAWARGRHGMGYGDFKLLAALGAWVGLVLLPYVLLAACVAGVSYALARQRTLMLSGSYPFGPFLAASGLGVLLLGPEVHSYFW